MQASAEPTGTFAGRQIIVGVTGGIAAFKTCALVSLLAQQNAAVTVVMTAAAQHFVGKATFAALSGRAVHDTIFAPEFPLGAHIELARQAEALIVAPASADFLAKTAHGLADDLLSTLWLSFTGKTLLAPAMNVEMWRKPAVERNVAQLRADGVEIIDPEEGWLSCRTQGVGRMAAPEVIAERVASVLNRR